MGQTASRNRTLTPSSPATVSTVSTADREVISDDSVEDIPTPAPKSRRSARSSVRRSLLKLVKPRSSQAEAQETARPSHSRKSWRTSRRWSKAAPTLAHDENGSASSSRLPPPSEKPPQLMDDPDAVPSMPQTHIVPEPESRQEPHHTNDVGSWLNDEDPSSSTDHVVFSPDHFTPTQDLPDVPEDVSPPPTINQPDLPSSPSAASPRQFPPPGTLVVVQGVVHTTDVPRVPGADTPSDLPDAQPVVPNQSASIPRPSTPTSASTEHSTSRNRVSALLRSRPASMASAVEVAAPESDLVTDAVSQTTESTEVTPPAPEPARHSGPISSSSIDVLGTLLSVAAAATAASLLTGSSEPILTSGLTPPTPNGTAPPLNDPARPLSPTPSSGSIDAIGSRTERMRLAWSSIRDRLGMRPPRSERNEDGQEGGDARERMLTEMARAFNLGLGINNNGSPEDNTAQNATTENPEVPTTPQLPAEGSFERFLVDLQLDLRATLSQRPGVEPRQREEVNPPPVAPQPQSPEGISESDWLPITVPTPSSPSQVPSRIANIGAEDDGDDDMPALQDVSDSDSEFSNTDIDSLREQNERPSPNVDIPPPSAEPQPPSDRINWWRLYRFPPIPAPRGANPLEVNLRPPGSASIPLPPAMTETASSSPSGNLASPTPSSSHIGPHPSPPAIVVPVIVVGLQSVSVSGSWPPRDAERPHDTRDGVSTASGQPPPPTESLEEDGEPRPDTPRGRRWHSRAASALRNLRPGRRPDAPDQPTEDPVGSRTFLIYVIGGYYPPDHSIVTGEPHNLDSFEALLDLAEILGQVKPPTASKEEIERSRLEVIKATQVPEYENDRKISSNCTERCLICLDDYAPEDDVRVMGCRHAFHKGCVDTWLQTGKNNCPACRGTGVSTDTSTEPVPTQ